MISKDRIEARAKLKTNAGMSTSLKLLAALFMTALLACVFCGCDEDENENNAMVDGFYTAEAAEFGETGWKEYITIYVSGNKIVTVEYNAKNASGFIKSWDMEYMRKMNASDGTYPNEYTRLYSDDLLNRQDPNKVDAISGATHSYHYFKALANEAINRAKKGDKNVAFVDLTGASSQ